MTAVTDSELMALMEAYRALSGIDEPGGKQRALDWLTDKLRLDIIADEMTGR